MLTNADEGERLVNAQAERLAEFDELLKHRARIERAWDQHQRSLLAVRHRSSSNSNSPAAPRLSAGGGGGVGGGAGGAALGRHDVVGEAGQVASEKGAGDAGGLLYVGMGLEEVGGLQMSVDALDVADEDSAAGMDAEAVWMGEQEDGAVWAQVPRPLNKALKDVGLKASSEDTRAAVTLPLPPPTQSQKQDKTASKDLQARMLTDADGC